LRLFAAVHWLCIDFASAGRQCSWALHLFLFFLGQLETRLGMLTSFYRQLFTELSAGCVSNPWYCLWLLCAATLRTARQLSTDYASSAYSPTCSRLSSRRSVCASIALSCLVLLSVPAGSEALPQAAARPHRGLQSPDSLLNCHVSRAENDQGAAAAGQVGPLQLLVTLGKQHQSSVGSNQSLSVGFVRQVAP
jgi:hypothetical protein